MWAPVQASRQRGVFTRRQAMDGGLSSDQASYRIATGVWRHVAGRAYAVAAASPQQHSSLHAMALTWPDAVLYGISALRYWEPIAPIAPDHLIHCAVPYGRAPQMGLAACRTIPPAESVVTREGMPIQRRTPAMAVTLAVLPPAPAQSLLAWMVARRKVSAEDFAAAITDYAPRTATRRLRSYLPLVAAGVASEAESLARSIFIRFGITGWKTNALVRTAAGEAKSADFYFSDIALIIMIDGWQYHGSRRAFQLDRQDQNGLVAAGHTVLRFTWDDLKNREAQVATQVRDVAARLTQAKSARRPPR
jgi:hypothetical protein